MDTSIERHVYPRCPVQFTEGTLVYNSLTLVPAYGRDYKSKRALLEDWDAGKDFMAMGIKSGTSGYTSIRDVDSFKQDNITHLHFRYNKQTQIHVVKL